MRDIHRSFVTALTWLALVGVSVAAAPAGTAVGVNPSATDVVKGGSRTLVVGADVAMGDKIVTGPSGQVQLIFNDDTHLVVGPGSALVIESYLLRSDKSVGSFAVNALGGTFRFITGQSDHSAYTINTPTGTIGVRGTAFDFTVGAGSAKGGFLPGTTVALFRGSVILCTLAHQSCTVLDRRCDAGWIQPAVATHFGPFESVDRGLRAKFRYIQSQKPLLPPFWVDESRQCFLDLSPVPGGLAPLQHGVFTPPPPRKGRLG
jgi:hypothetical protein